MAKRKHTYERAKRKRRAANRANAAARQERQNDEQATPSKRAEGAKAASE